MNKKTMFFEVINRYFTLLLLLLTVFGNSSCKKIVQIDEPVSSITTTGVFSTDATANSSVAGIYSNLINGSAGITNFGSGSITLYCGLSANELNRWSAGGTDLNELFTSNISPYNSLCLNIWSTAYFTIYQSNACLDGLQKATAVSDSTKRILTGECKFLRAFSYFYLTNLWGDVPLFNVSDWNKTYQLPRAAQSKIYDQIVADLKDAQLLLPVDYNFAGDERIRANKFAATALLARVYLYLGKWIDADTQATAVINNSSTYSLVPDLNSVFLKNSNEAILQFQPSGATDPYAVNEQYSITNSLYWVLTDDVINAFESGDLRTQPKNWVDTVNNSGVLYYYPTKYKVSYGTSGAIPDEYYMVLRLAEQYLIRAEAEANGAGNGITGAIADINSIRSRAGLIGYSGPSNKDSLLRAIEHERQVELFAEWGHRWVDLKRTNRATAILGPIKGTNWQSTDQLYPVPISEIQRNPNLTQNSGY